MSYISKANNYQPAGDFPLDDKTRRKYLQRPTANAVADPDSYLYDMDAAMRYPGMIVTVEDARTAAEHDAGAAAYTRAFQLNGGLTNDLWKPLEKTTNAGDLTEGTLLDARLSTNIPKKDGTNSWTGNQWFNAFNIGSLIMGLGVTGEPHNRIRVYTDKIGFGGGAAVVDTFIKWVKAGHLLVDHATSILEAKNIWENGKPLADAYVPTPGETIVTTTGILNNQATPSGTIRFTGAAAVSLSGLDGGKDGKDMLLINATAFDLTLMHQNAGSLDGNRLIIQGSDNVYIRPGGACRLRYSSSQSAWQMSDLWGSEYFPTLKGTTTRTMVVTPGGYAQAEENVELNTILLNQTLDMSKADLNTAYPNHVRGQRILCPNLTNGGKVYEKIDDSTHDWISTAISIVV